MILTNLTWGRLRSVTLHLFILVACSILICSESIAEPVAEVILAPEGGNSGDTFGHAIDVYGEYLIVGAPGDDEQAVDSGAVYIYKRGDSPMYALQKKRTLTVYPKVNGDDGFGTSVAISADYALAGSRGYMGVPFFDRGSDDSWRMSDIHSPDDIDVANFGCAVSVAGKYAVIGASIVNGPGGTLAPGQTKMFKLDETSWTDIGLLSIPSHLMYDYFGAATSMSGDYLAVGQPNGIVKLSKDDWRYGAGQVFIYKRSGDSWSYLVTITAPELEEYVNFGSSLSLSGEYLAVGSKTSTYVFKREGESWVQQAKVPGSGDIAISSSYLLSVSKLAVDKTLYVFKRVGASWVELTKIPAPYEGKEYPSVALSSDKIFLGLPSSENNTGRIDVYNFPVLYNGGGGSAEPAGINATYLLLLNGNTKK